MTPAQTNATLTKVTRGGRTEEPGSSTAPTEGPAIFDGSVRVYYQEKRERIVTGAGREVLVRRILHVDTRAPAIEWLEEDVVTFARDRDPGTPIVSAVETVTAAELGELAGSGVETTRIELEPK